MTVGDSWTFGLWLKRGGLFLFFCPFFSVYLFVARAEKKTEKERQKNTGYGRPSFTVWDLDREPDASALRLICEVVLCWTFIVTSTLHRLGTLAAKPSFMLPPIPGKSPSSPSART